VNERLLGFRFSNDFVQVDPQGDYALHRVSKGLMFSTARRWSVVTARKTASIETCGARGLVMAWTGNGTSQKPCATAISMVGSRPTGATMEARDGERYGRCRSGSTHSTLDSPGGNGRLKGCLQLLRGENACTSKNAAPLARETKERRRQVCDGVRRWCVLVSRSVRQC
jgi:hypothetical protein